MAGVRGDIKPLYPPRGIPPGLAAHGFSACYRQIVDQTESLGYRNSKFVLTYEVGHAEVFLFNSTSQRWGWSKKGYIRNEAIEVPSWLTLSEFKASIAHAGLDDRSLPL